MTRSTRYIVLAAAGSVVGLVPGARAGTYTATDLTPNGFAVIGGYANPNPLGGYNGIGFTGDLEVQNGHQPRAINWSPDGKMPTDVHPSGWSASHGLATNGTTQVGYGSPASSALQHALVWKNNAAVDLHPTGLLPSGSSQAVGVSPSGNTQFGYGFGFSPNAIGSHALIWKNTAASVVDLNPSNFTSSWANAGTDTQTVGTGNGTPTGNQNHALAWNGTSNVPIDLHPASSPGGSSEALGTDGTSQVGDATVGGGTHAYVWKGSAASGIDLNPAGFAYSLASAVNGNIEVGKGYSSATGNQWHALLWTGSASSAIDLQQYLPSKFQYSFATSIDGSGDVFGFAFDPNSGMHAVEFVNSGGVVVGGGPAVPEPAALSLIGVISTGLLSRRRKH